MLGLGTLRERVRTMVNVIVGIVLGWGVLSVVVSVLVGGSFARRTRVAAFERRQKAYSRAA